MFAITVWLKTDHGFSQMECEQRHMDIAINSKREDVFMIQTDGRTRA